MVHRDVGIFMQESLFVPPDNFDAEILAEAQKHADDPDVLYVAGDIPEDVILSEDEAVAILANYGQVMNFLHKKQLGRGFFRPGAQGQKGAGKEKTGTKSTPPPLCGPEPGAAAGF